MTVSVKTINDIQEEIIQEFRVLGDDRESTVFYIMDLGKKLPPMSEEDKTESNLIKGCQSKVWLKANPDEGRLFFTADSNTEITKGLISLLVRILSGQRMQDILTADLYFIHRIGMGNIIGAQRSNGLASMIKQIRLYALAYQTKLNISPKS
jgi:cysteine desulfuration protein SufE